MNNCARCTGTIPEPDLTESLAREADWRQWAEDHPTELLAEPDKRVLICAACADELELSV